MKNYTLIYIIAGVLIVLFFSKSKKKKDMFDRIMKIVFRHEGGYVNDPDDLGGETNFGITARRYPDLDIKNLTKEQAKEIYHRDFWLPMKMERFKDNINLALNVFDMAVNAGKQYAELCLSKANIEKKYFPEKDIVELYKEERRKYYTRVAERLNNKKFLKGWLNRVNTSVA